MSLRTEAATPSIMVERVAAWLGWPDDATPRLLTYAAGGPPPRVLDLPTGSALALILERLRVPTSAIAEIVDALPSPETHPEALWLIERLYRQLTAGGSDVLAPPWPAPVSSDEPLKRFVHLYAFVAAVTDVLALHARRGIAEDVTWSTLGDVGLQVANYEFRHGVPGFDGAFWVWQHFRGDTFQIGRLQYNFEALAVDVPDACLSKGDEVLAVHIPAAGPLSPEGCDESLTLAAEFFARHFPERPIRVATCASWLLDGQLAEYLPETGNIIRFQRRFHVVDSWCQPGHDDIVRFVFGYLPRDIEELPQRTSLERAVVSHLRAGRHWHNRLGWLEL